MFFREIRRKQRDYEPLGVICDTQGNKANNMSEILNNWTLFYKELYSSAKGSDEHEVEHHASSSEFGSAYFDDYGDDVLNSEITLGEFYDALRSLKNHKAPGIDFITNDDLKFFLQVDLESEEAAQGRVGVLLYIFRVLQGFWVREVVPPTCKTSLVRPFLKGSIVEKDMPSRYRPVSLLNSIMKLYEAVLGGRVRARLESSQFLSSTQAAYRRGKSTSVHIFDLQELFFHYR